MNQIKVSFHKNYEELLVGVVSHTDRIDGTKLNQNQYHFNPRINFCSGPKQKENYDRFSQTQSLNAKKC